MSKLKYAIVGLALIGFAASCFPQAPAPCIVGRADAHRYAVKYTPKPGQTFDPSCPATLTAPWREDLWLTKYVVPSEDINKIAIRPTRFVKKNFLADGGVGPTSVAGVFDPAHEVFAQGSFTTSQEEEGLCTVPTLNEARQDIPTSSAMTTRVTTSYQWSNMKFLSGAEFQGTMMGSDLTFTQGTCTVHYDAVAIWPGDVPCEEDAECLDPNSTLNPGYQTACFTGRCVAASPFPSLRAEQ